MLNHIQGLLVGPSRSGKTNLLINLLLLLEGLGWDRVVLVWLWSALGDQSQTSQSQLGLEEHPIYQPLRKLSDRFIETRFMSRMAVAATEGREATEDELASMEDPISFAVYPANLSTLRILTLTPAQ